MRLMLDSNVAIDYLAKREPFYAGARMLFILGKLGEVELWFTSAQANDIFYLLSRGGRRSLLPSVKAAVKELRSAAHLCGLGEAEFDAALDSTWDDLEDACVYQAALKVKADAIITRNQQDFLRSSIKVFDCEELFAWLEAEKGLVYEEIPR